MIPPETLLRLLLAALGVRDAESIVEAMQDEEGRFVWPDGPPLGSGQAAVNASRGGRDPTNALQGGPMTPDNEDDEPEGGDPP